MIVAVPGGSPLAASVRSLLRIAAVLVFFADVQLFLFPQRTAEYFAWTIGSPMTVVFLGASYWSAVGQSLAFGTVIVVLASISAWALWAPRPPAATTEPSGR